MQDRRESRFGWTGSVEWPKGFRQCRKSKDEGFYRTAPVSLKGLLCIGGGTLGNQLESPTPRFVSKVAQLSAPSFCISRLNFVKHFATFLS